MDKPVKSVNLNEQTVVRKSEILVKSKYSLSPLATKFIVCVIASVKRSDPIDQEYVFSISRFSELTGQKTHRIYELIDQATSDLLKNPIKIPTEEGKGFIKFNWISSASYLHGQGSVSFCIDKKLRPYIIDVKEKYLKYKLEYILRLRSSYSIRIYEMLKDWISQEKRYKKKRVIEKIVEVSWLRDTLEIPLSYRYNDFKRFVLQKAQKEIEKNTDIKFTFEEIKTGRKVSHLKFYIIETKEDKERQGIKGNNELKELISSLKTKENVKLEYIYDAYMKHGYDYVKRNIDYANKYATDNYPAYLAKALKEDWASASKKNGSILESKEYKEYQRFIGKTVNIGNITYEVESESLYNSKTNAAIPIIDVLKNWNYWKPYFENSK